MRKKRTTGPWRTRAKSQPPYAMQEAAMADATPSCEYLRVGYKHSERRRFESIMFHALLQAHVVQIPLVVVAARRDRRRVREELVCASRCRCRLENRVVGAYA